MESSRSTWSESRVRLIPACLRVHIYQSLTERNPDVTINRNHIIRLLDGHIYSRQDMVVVVLCMVVVVLCMVIVVLCMVVLCVRLNQLEFVKLNLIVDVVFARSL